MKPFLLAITFLGLFAYCSGQDSTWSLVWSDEFNRPPLDTTSWNYDVGTGDHGWGNGELQSYTQGENLSFKDSCLVIELRRQTAGAAQYTSTRINTRKKVELQYGKIQIRLKAPYSQAVWPAVWTLGADFNPPAVSWPACGEIDIFEMACGENYPDDRGDNSNFAVVHYTDPLESTVEAKKSIRIGGRMSDEFHVFTLEWDENFLSFYFDSAAIPYLQVDITKPYMSEFHQPHSLVIDMALGGIGFAGYPDASTVLPQYLTVDWIRWYQKKAGIRDGYERRNEAAGQSIEKNSGGLSFNILVPSRSFLRFFDLRGRLVADLSAWAHAQTPGWQGTAWERLPVRRGAYCISFSDGMHPAKSTIALIK
jgi:beta-glucanase (GH16 family)